MCTIYSATSTVCCLRADLNRLEETFRPAAMSGFISDLLTASLSNHARSLTANQHFNGHPDLVVKGVYANNRIQRGSQGVEIKSTRKRGGAVDTHGARDQWLCVFVYNIDNETEPARERLPTTFTEVYLAHVGLGDFRKNPRGELGTPEPLRYIGRGYRNCVPGGSTRPVSR